MEGGFPFSTRRRAFSVDVSQQSGFLWDDGRRRRQRLGKEARDG